jgi:hypothetical protein
MSQRNSHRSIAETNRLLAAPALLRVRGSVSISLISLVLVLLITSGGAG